MSTYEELITAALLNPPDPLEPLPASNRKETLYGTVFTFLILSWIAVIFRLWVRFRVVREPGWDDAFIFAAVTMDTAACVCVHYSIGYGLGHHMLYLSMPVLRKYSIFFYLAESIYVTNCAVIKISLLLQYLRIFKAGFMRRACIGLLILVSLWGLAFAFLAWFPCFPVRGTWDRTIPATCYGFGFANVQDFVLTFKVQAATNITFDLLIFITPMVLFATPNLRLKNVLAMTGVFSVGAAVCGTSVWRLYIIADTRAATYPYLDFTWWSPMMIILSCLEIDLAIMCASIPIFWPLIEKSFSAIFVSYEVQVVEERVEEYGLAYELEHMKRSGSVKSSGTSTHELREDEESGGMDTTREYTIGLDPLSEDVKTGGIRTEVRSKPKPKWEL